jgi:hypothetical protein
MVVMYTEVNMRFYVSLIVSLRGYLVKIDILSEIGS